MNPLLKFILVVTSLSTLTNGKLFADDETSLASHNEGVSLREVDHIQFEHDILPRTPTLEVRATTTAPAKTGSTVLCGPENGNAICASGLCCSSQGNCGIGAAYCGAGCMASFGGCGTSTSSFKPGPTGSTNLCGPNNGNTVCADSYCCSSGGFCGRNSSYCADPNCQFNFGTCDSNKTPAGQSTEKDPRPLIGNLTYARDIYHCSAPNVVALTYDDGPLNYTVEILDLLKKYEFHATFFVCGNNLGKGAIDTTAPYPDIIKRMINEGHQVASHTWSHYNLDTLTTAQRIAQLTKNERSIANILGFYPTYLRPPYSGCQSSTGCQADIQALGYHRVYFDFDTDDYLNDTPLLIQTSKDKVDQALKNATQGTDLLSIQHDIDRQGANLTEHYYQAIKARGWKGVAVGECLNDDPKNWYRTPGNGSALTRAPYTGAFALEKGNNTDITAPATVANPSATTDSAPPASTSKTGGGSRIGLHSAVGVMTALLAIAVWL